MKKMWNERLTEIQRQFVAYSLIGVMGLSIDLIGFYFMSSVLKWHYLLANGISVYSAITHNFLWNALVNFKTKDRFLWRYGSFLMVGTVGLGLSSILLWIQVEKLGIEPIIGKVLTIGVVVFVQFGLNKWITFKPQNIKENSEK
ncbi:GtrA family protein [bacterium]|nr:GtrA family protein [bacterium]